MPSLKDVEKEVDFETQRRARTREPRLPFVLVPAAFAAPSLCRDERRLRCARRSREETEEEEEETAAEETFAAREASREELEPGLEPPLCRAPNRAVGKEEAPPPPVAGGVVIRSFLLLL